MKFSVGMVLAMSKKVLQVPHDVYITLTGRCNLRCLHCYGNYGRVCGVELTGKQWVNVFKNLGDSGVFFANISGGEPTVHPDFVEIIKYLKSSNFHFILTTNGVFPDNIRKAILLASSVVAGLKFSLDGPTPESHTFIRKTRGGMSNTAIYKVTLDNIKYFSTKGFPITVATCLHSGNINLLDEFVDLIEDLSPVSWFVSTLSPTGRATHNKNIFVSDRDIGGDKWNSIRNRLSNKNIYVRYIDMPYAEDYDLSKSRYQCPAARWSCEINSDGLVSPCTMARIEIPRNKLAFENILDADIVTIWHGKAFTQFRDWQDVGCPGCRMQQKCDKCIPQSFKWFSDAIFPPAFCVGRGKFLGFENLKDLERELAIKLASVNRDATNFGKLC